MVFYVCRNNKIAGIYIILLSILALLYIFVSVKREIKYYLTPLLIWLLFALIIKYI